MDGRTPVVWCVLALLVVSAAVSHAVTLIALDSMTWTADTLTVCAAELSPDATIFHLAANADPFTDTAGVINPDNATCVNFNITGLPSEPLPDATKYEFTTFYNSTEELQSGSVTFAFPLSQGTKIECGTTPESTPFTRFIVEDGGGSALSGSDCLTDSASSVCYISGEDDPVCVTGLDQSPGNEGFKVCVPIDDEPMASTVGLISAVSLAYDEDRTGGSFTISSGTETNPIELLSVIHDSGNDPHVTICGGNVCPFESGDPSTKLYDLCSVYVASGSVTSVGNYSFQDLQLTVDVVVDTVDFRFANLNTPDLTYDVYGGAIASELTTSGSHFTLDCSHISETSFCNGFFDDNPPPAFIGVSFSGSDDVVIAYTTTPSTTTTETTSTTVASVPLSKVKENAMDLTDQNTEDIVPSSA